MRIIQDPQMQIGEVDISQIQFDLKSRDEMPQVLLGLQYLYKDLAVRKEIFNLLETHISPEVNKKNGRPGMDLWKILVFGVVRLNLNWNYDRLHDEANNHKKIREMLGHSDFNDNSYYNLQTIKDNVSLFTLELLDKVNEIVVKAGHKLIKKKDVEILRGRTDSFVVETNVHYPTDINLLWDAMRKIITLTTRLSNHYGFSDWRQSQYNLNHVKRLMRNAQNKKGAKATTEVQKEKNKALMIAAHALYIEVSTRYINNAKETLKKIETQRSISLLDVILINSIKTEWIGHANRQISQIERRVIQGEIIPSSEKVFSLFQPHTEWIVKGKAGIPMELGLKVCIVEDQNQFILHHQVIENKMDNEITIEITEGAQKRFPNLRTNSYDKGFHSPENQSVLAQMLDLVVLPRKGKLSVVASEFESTKEFVRERRQHSAIESAINAIEVHGLDICLDHGIHGFKKYVALAIIARNIQRIGAILKTQQQRKEEKRRNREYVRNNALKRVA